MADPEKERRFILKWGEEELDVLSAKGYESKNYVQVSRRWGQKAALLLKTEDVEKMFEDLQPLKITIFDSTRSETFEGETDPVFPVDVKAIDNKVTLVSFDTSTPFDTVMTRNVPPPPAAGASVAFGGPYHYASVSLGMGVGIPVQDQLNLSDVTSLTTDTNLGIHAWYVDIDQRTLNHSVQAMMGVKILKEHFGDEKFRIFKADEEQADLEEWRPEDYVVQESPKLERKFKRPWLQSFAYRQSAFSTSWWNSVSLGASPLTLPTNLTSRDSPYQHYSTLIVPDSFSAASSALPTRQNAKKYFEANCKAVQRTLAAYNRNAFRSDWYRLFGFHRIAIGTEIASITYRNDTTFVDFRDYSVPEFPKHVPMVSGAQMTVGLVNVVASTVSGELATSGGFPLERNGMFPLLQPGDVCLAAYDGTKATVINAPLTVESE